MKPAEPIVEAQPTGAPRAPQRSSARLVLLILGGLALVSCLGVGAIALVVARMAPQLQKMAKEVEKPRPLGERDRAVLVTIDDVAAEDDIDRAVEKFIVNPYGNWSVQYQYPPGHGTFVFCHIVSSGDAASAVLTYKLLLTSFDLAIGDKLTVKERDDLFRWGDDSRFAHLLRDGEPVGTRFVARKGTLIYTFSIVGIVFDDTESAERLLKGKLEQLESYRPSILPP